MAGDFERIVGVVVAPSVKIVLKRRIETVPHEVNIALGGPPGYLELFDQVPGVRVSPGLDLP